MTTRSSAPPRRSAALRLADARAEARAATAAAGVEEHLRHVQRLVMQGELAASAVHEISNLLTIVLFNASLLRELHKGDLREKKYIEPLLHAATVIAKLCSQLRNLSRPTRPQSSVIDLTEAARGTFRLLQQIMTRELVFTAPTDGPVLIHADPAHIDQVLVNLVLNARDATRDDVGRISVQVGRTADTGSYIEVKDNGTGMSPEVRRQMFRIFFTTKPPGFGTGLGMVTVQRLTHGMGGKIQIRSRLGAGTRVRLLFPAPVLADEPSVSFPEAISPGSRAYP